MYVSYNVLATKLTNSSRKIVNTKKGKRGHPHEYFTYKKYSQARKLRSTQLLKRVWPCVRIHSKAPPGQRQKSHHTYPFERDGVTRSCSSRSSGFIISGEVKRRYVFHISCSKKIQSVCDNG